MRLHRFFAPQPIENDSKFEIHSTELVHQVRRVFRLKVGDTIIIFNGTGFDYECKIDGFKEGNKIGTDSSIILHTASLGRSAFSPGLKSSAGSEDERNSFHDLYLCAGIVKKDTFEWMTEKATEIGVSHILPIMAERSEKKSLNEERLKKIAIEASEQSGRGTVPEILPLMALEESLRWFKDTKGETGLIAFHTESDLISNSREWIKDKKSLAVFIGPEGGWSPDEIDLFHKNGARVVGLGPQVLRAETAVVAALSVISFGNI